MDSSWLDDQDETIQALLAGSKGDFRDCAASEIAEQWLREAGHFRRKGTVKTPLQPSLTNALARAVFEIACLASQDSSSRHRWIQTIFRWLRARSVSRELSRLVDPKDTGQLNLDRLEQALDSLQPGGRKAVLEKKFGAPTVTKDGVTVAKEIELDGRGKPIFEVLPPFFPAFFLQEFQKRVVSERNLSKAIGGERLTEMVEPWVPRSAARGLEMEGGGLERSAGPDTAEKDASEETAPPLSATLFASHWLENNQDQTFDMNAVLEPATEYWYGFRIGREARTGASATVFDEPAALAKKEKTTVFLEVSCDLLGSEKFVRRRVTYTRGTGLTDHYFLLTTPTKSTIPAHLRIQIIHDNIPVYTQNWSLRIAGKPQDASLQPPTGPAIAATEPPVQGLGGTGDFGPVVRKTFRLKCDRNRFEILSPDMQSWPGTVPQLLVSPHATMVAARRRLKQFAEEKGQEKTFTEDTVSEFLRDLAIWGRDCHDQIFDGPNGPLRDIIEAIPADSFLAIDTDSPSFPWEWLFSGEVPGPDEDFLKPGARAQFLSGFWGVRFAISILPAVSSNRIGLHPRLANAEDTRVLSSVNPTAYPDTAKSNIDLFKDLPKSYRRLKTQVAQGRQETVEMLRKSVASETPPHLVYFYCHHRAGKITNEFGYLDDRESILYLRGEDKEPLSVKELKYDVQLAPFSIPETPLVFLNACGTAQGQDFHPSGFVPYFTSRLLASSVVCTLAEIPAGQGLKMFRDFLGLWFGKTPAASALQSLRRDWLLQELNPFAMYYTLNGIAHLSLTQELKP